MHVLSFERVTFEEERQQEADFWANKSVAERVKAGWDLAEYDLFQRRRNDEQAERAAITFRRVEQSWR